MKQYDDFDKRLEAVMKKNLQGTHASQDLINKTLLRLGEEKTKAVVTPVKKKRRAIPVAIISSIAAILLALVGVLFVFLRLSSVKKEDKVTRSPAMQKDEIAEVAGEESIEIKGNRSYEGDAVYSDDSVAMNKDSELESVDSVQVVTYSGDHYRGGDYSLGEEITKENSTQYYFGAFNFTYVATPFDNLNNFYFSIEDRTYTSADDFRINNNDNDDNLQDYRPGRLVNR